MKAQFFEGRPVLNAAARMNNGDGIRMAQHLGAELWHMWHIHGAYGFRHTDPGYPYGIRVKRMPDWFPGESDKVKVRMAWILVDQAGKRFMSEYQPYTQDTGVRQLGYFDAVTQRFPRNPSFLVCDEEGRKMYPLGKATSNDEGIRYDWSDDNLKEVGLGSSSVPTHWRPGAAAGIDAARSSTASRAGTRCAGAAATRIRASSRLRDADQTPPYYAHRCGDAVEHPGGRCDADSASSTSTASRSRASTQPANSAARSDTCIVGRQHCRMLCHRPRRRQNAAARQ
jgi:hypothetical protein